MSEDQWDELGHLAAERDLLVSREDPRVQMLADIDDAVAPSTRYARIIVPRCEGQSDEQRDALLRALAAAAIEAVRR